MAIWIAGICPTHDGGVSLLKDGNIVFSIQEERLSRHKYDGTPLLSMLKILDYTNKLDYLAIAETRLISDNHNNRANHTGENIYISLARKLGLIDKKADWENHPQVIDYGRFHHRLHAAGAFYKSGFENAVAVIVDCRGSSVPLAFNDKIEACHETESVFSCEYPVDIKTLYKHCIASNVPKGIVTEMRNGIIMDSRFRTDQTYVSEEPFELIFNETAGICTTYDAVSFYCGFERSEAGKTMGLFPYGAPNNKIPKIYSNFKDDKLNIIDSNNFIGDEEHVIENKFDELRTDYSLLDNKQDVTTLKNRRDLAYAVQKESQEEVLKLIYKAVEMTGNKNVVLAGGYGLNCVANYYFKEHLNKDGINFYVDPASGDMGIATGAALVTYHMVTKSKEIFKNRQEIYLGFDKKYTEEEINSVVKKYNGQIKNDVENVDIVKLLRDKNIVCLFQGRSENGPRALGNRSILFDPTFPDGKDFVNRVKRREYFRPFAGSILHEHAHEWFDMRGLEESPHMMYAMNCQPEIAKKIPSIIHVDGTCRIQTVKREQNFLYYELIKEFHKETNIPILFNTSFNLGGEPLVETLDDAVRTLAYSEMEYLYLPEYNKLIIVKNT